MADDDEENQFNWISAKRRERNYIDRFYDELIDIKYPGYLIRIPAR